MHKSRAFRALERLYKKETKKSVKKIKGCRTGELIKFINRNIIISILFVI